METSIDSEFERVLSLVYPPLDFPDVYSRIFDFNWLPNSYHKESFREHCVYVAHCMEKLCRRDNLLQEIWKEGISYAYLVGFLHDIGKPFVEYINGFKRHNFKGHAQIGARMVTLRFQDEIPEDILLTMGVLIDLSDVLLAKSYAFLGTSFESQCCVADVFTKNSTYFQFVNVPTFCESVE
ncbi:uncharacterized protein TNCT_665071 [Trichonephila clavata]|uniref:HD domain-containing protein n=1 Tax=Trichonephila clavata TaxID=2740835 RepID=A0A8X6FQM9_TRICU|nr:uncharacterized protein TNCT_665071 [Trichonephila clavata]